jgi:ribosomal protein L37AE/L43A
VSALDIILALRGGHPERCEFCGEPYDDKRRPEPEEAGAWACSVCVERWALLEREAEEDE